MAVIVKCPYCGTLKEIQFISPGGHFRHCGKFISVDGNIIEGTKQFKRISKTKSKKKKEHEPLKVKIEKPKKEKEVCPDCGGDSLEELKFIDDWHDNIIIPEGIEGKENNYLFCTTCLEIIRK